MKALLNVMGGLLVAFAVMAYMLGHAAGENASDGRTELPACRYDDGSLPKGADSCLWDATTQGNRAGDSFINYKGKIFLDNTTR